LRECLELSDTFSFGIDLALPWREVDSVAWIFGKNLDPIVTNALSIDYPTSILSKKRILSLREFLNLRDLARDTTFVLCLYFELSFEIYYLVGGFLRK